QENDDRDQEDDLDRAGDLEDPLRNLLPVAHLVDRGELLLLERERDALRVLSSLRYDVEGGRKRVRGEVRGELGIPLAHDVERLVLVDERDAAGLDALVRLERGAKLVDLLVGSRVPNEDVNGELVLLGVRPRHEPGPEADEDAHEEHPDEHGQGRCEGGRDVRADRAERLREDGPDLGHSSAYPPRRSSRTSRPDSSAMTRLRILSTISRSWVTIRIVVPVRLMR